MTGNYQRIRTHQRYRLPSILKDSDSHFARVVEPVEKDFSITTRFFHSNFRCDVSLGKSGTEGFPRLRVDGSDNRRRTDGQRSPPESGSLEKVSPIHASPLNRFQI